MYSTWFSVRSAGTESAACEAGVRRGCSGGGRRRGSCAATTRRCRSTTPGLWSSDRMFDRSRTSGRRAARAIAKGASAETFVKGTAKREERRTASFDCRELA